MSAPRTMKIEHAGRTWCGSWRATGKMLHVESAYGSKCSQLGRLTPDQLALQLLRELVQARLTTSEAPSEAK
jgi:hypothetical protein